MGGGAWPFLVGGAICLVNSVNERDLGLLNSYADPAIQNLAAESWSRPERGGQPSRSALGAPPRQAVGSAATLLRGTAGIQPTEARGNNRSVMPLDVLGRTRATLIETASPSASAEGSGQPRQPRSCWG
jgi:hypothetical protein